MRNYQQCRPDNGDDLLQKLRFCGQGQEQQSNCGNGENPNILVQSASRPKGRPADQKYRDKQHGMKPLGVMHPFGQGLDDEQGGNCQQRRQYQTVGQAQEGEKNT